MKKKERALVGLTAYTVSPNPSGEDLNGACAVSSVHPLDAPPRTSILFVSTISLVTVILPFQNTKCSKTRTLADGREHLYRWFFFFISITAAVVGVRFIANGNRISLSAPVYLIQTRETQ